MKVVGLLGLRIEGIFFPGDLDDMNPITILEHIF